MSIEMYDRATVVKKGGKFHYLVKHGSKNTFSIGSRINNHFRREYPTRQVRASDWRLVAISEGMGRMGDTSWNAPTSWIYGRIMFGNKRNIALYLDKLKPLEYEDFDEWQKANFDSILDIYSKENYARNVIDLADIKEEQSRKSEHDYCGKKISLDNHKIEFGGRFYWDLDNL
jgi:hypothetical protein